MTDARRGSGEAVLGAVKIALMVMGACLALAGIAGLLIYAAGRFDLISGPSPWLERLAGILLFAPAAVLPSIPGLVEGGFLPILSVWGIIAVYLVPAALFFLLGSCFPRRTPAAPENRERSSSS